MKNLLTTVLILFCFSPFNLFGQVWGFPTFTVNGSSTINGASILNGTSVTSGIATFNGTARFNNYAEFFSGVLLGGELRSSGWEFKFGHSPTQNFVYYDFTNKMYFRSMSSSSTSPLLLQSDGSIVVNSQTNFSTTGALFNTQGYKLAVNGGILCEEIKVIVDVPKWDIVFEPDYRLMSLYDVEKYILKNKHLPDIPSAIDFQTNGYKLGEMDGLLLKKTEELTLHMIEMRKEMDAITLQYKLQEQKTSLLEEQIKLLKLENEKLKKELATNN